MPKDLTDAVDKELPGFSLNERVEELKRKLHLRKKESECYKESSRTELLANERIIRMMRSNNQIRRLLFAQDNSDGKMIATVLQNEKREKLKLQRFSVQKAIEEMDEKVSEAENALNMMRDLRVKHEDKIDKFYDNLDYVYNAEAYEKKLDNTSFGMQGVTTLENDFDKAVMRCNAARNINHQYHKIIDHMQYETRHYPNHLDAMEAALLQVQREKEELQLMRDDALKSLEETKSRLSQVEAMTIDSKKKREVEMAELRKEVERRQRKNLDQFSAGEREKKAFRASLLTANLDQQAMLEMQEKIERCTKILDHLETSDVIKTATATEEIEDVVEAIVAQDRVNTKLSKQVEEMEAKKRKEVTDLDELKNQYHELKYSGEVTITQNRKLLDDTHEFLMTEEKRLGTRTSELDKNGKLLADVKVGVSTLLDKLSQVKLKPPAFNYVSSGDVFEEISLCEKKIVQMQVEVMECMESDEEMGPHTEEKLGTDVQFQGFLESRLPSDNVRIKVEEHVSHMSVFENEGPDNDGVLSRIERKNQSQRICDLKERKLKIPKKK